MMSIEVQPESRPALRRPATPALIPPATRLQRNPNGYGWWKRALIAVGILGVLAAAGYAMFQSLTPEPTTDVLTHEIVRGDLVVSVTEQGTLESSSNKEIKCKVKGGSTVLWVIETGTEVQPGDELVRLDTSTIEDNISQQKIVYENALANRTLAEADVAVAKISINEYLEGTFRSEKATKEKELVIAESNLKAAKNSLDHAQKMFRRGYISSRELATHEDGVKHAELEVNVKQTDLEVLEKFTKAKTLQELESLLAAAEARLAADVNALQLEKARLDREQQQLENCVIRAEVAGLVIYPSAAEWKEQPDIEEGAVVREDQVLLIIPDLKKMQVKIGIHESKVDRVKPGMLAQIQLQDGVISGRVLTVSSVTKPTGWWNGNMVKYDTVIELTDQRRNLKPGMSVAVDVFLARYEDVLTIPVAAVLQQGDQSVCWVKTQDGIVKRTLQLGDSNDKFMVVESGLKEGDLVVLNPIDFVDAAQAEALKPGSAKTKAPREFQEANDDGQPASSAAGDDSPDNKKPKAEETAQAILQAGDKNGDGVLTKDEFDEKSKPHFEAMDTNSNGEVDASEIAAGLKRMQEAATQK